MRRMINGFKYKTRASSIFTLNVFPEPFTPARVKVEGLK